jgi:TolB-like protein/Flp pilus assembly protein TadD/predicted Ser/Thr protein kinase
MPLAPGTRLGPYEIIGPIDAGGMGEVYKARDTRLDRTVAIKRLKGEHTARFAQEARAIAALDHENICRIYDIGPDYFVMEYIEGSPLKGPLAAHDAIRLAIQIARALEEAHSKRILHRDLKPGNILVTVRGAAKLLDFGLAKLITDGDATQTMAVMGTPAYMSPEQVEAKPVDVRSDVFGFGVVLYEMLSGRRPFDNLAAVLRDRPAPLDSPAAEIVMRCLAKQPGDRFQTMTEVKAALEQIVAAKPSEQKPSIAVLPFANMSADKEDEYFSDGLAEEIINELAQVSGLKVIARTSSFAFRGKEQDVRGIAGALGVAHILEGSVRKAGGRIRVTAQLIAASDGSHLWSQRYDRELADVFAIQDEIAQAITTALKVMLAGKPATQRHQPTLPAYEAFLKGRHYLSQGTPDALAHAKDYFEQAIALDPGFAEPHAGLGAQYMVLGLWGAASAKEVIPLARAAARKALELSPGEPHAHGLLGLVAALHDFNWKEAQKQFRMAMAADPVPPEVRIRHCGFRLIRGHTDYVIEEMEKVLEQDPLSGFARSIFSMCLNGAGMFERANAESRKALEIDGRSFLAYFELALSYVLRGMLADAKPSSEEAHRLAPGNSGSAGLLAGLYTLTGDKERAETLLGQLKPAGRVIYHAICADFDTAADWYKKVIERREEMGIMLASMGIWKPLRETRHWPELARMMNLPEAEV